VLQQIHHAHRVGRLPTILEPDLRRELMHRVTQGKLALLRQFENGERGDENKSYRSSATRILIHDDFLCDCPPLILLSLCRAGAVAFHAPPLMP
jgi:hypothetical protein